MSDIRYMGHPQPDFHSVNEYIISGIPWVISGETNNVVVKYSFPKITKNFTVHNTSKLKYTLRIGFTENGINGIGENRYFIVDSEQVITFDARVKDLYVRSDTTDSVPYSIYASLTPIDQKTMPMLTGSIDGVAQWSGVG